MQLIARERESHWYQWCAETGCIIPRYSTPLKDGSGMRNVTLKDAKEHKYMVGISTIANMLPKTALESWKQEQAILAALTLPRVAGISIDEHAKLVAIDMQAQSIKAKEFGTRIHDGIEKILRGVMPDPDLEPWLAGFRTWADEWILAVHGTEMVVGDPALGVAGRLDLDCTLKDIGHTVIDGKSQRIKQAPVFYKEWAIQLSGYRHCLQRERPGEKYQILSLIVNTAEPGPVHWQLWPDYDYFAVFQHCLALWIYQNDFNPSQL